MKPGQSKYLKEYLEFVSRDAQGLHFEPPPQEILKLYRTEMVNEESFSKRQRKYDIRLCYVSSEASTATYIVDLGVFRLTIHILNLQGKAPAK